MPLRRRRCRLGFLFFRWYSRGGVCCACLANVFWPLRWHPCRRLRGAARFAFFAFALASALRCLPFKRRPCAGRHLLFFAAAKKSRQKKAAHTANSRICLRAPKGSHASHGNHVTHVCCQRFELTPHPPRAPASQHAVPDIPRPPRWQTVCRPLVLHTPHSGPIAHAFHPVRAPRYTTRQPTHSLPPGRHIPFAAAGPSTGIRSG